MTAETGTATASIQVACDPGTAFKVFTADIGTWWKRGTHYWSDAQRAAEMRFEPHAAGGRLVEVYDVATGEGFEIGRITVWEPGERLVFGWRTAEWQPGQSTEVEVRFAPVAAGTEVTIEHRGWDSLPGGGDMAAGYSGGWAELLGWFAERTA
jgi:uncharacterized protein YndB with AHSA1/START domain